MPGSQHAVRVCCLALLAAVSSPRAALGAGDAAQSSLQPMCNDAGWCWAHPFPQGNLLSALWTEPSGAVWAAGDEGTVLRFDGHVWRALPSPGPARLLAIWGSGAEDVWVAGGRDTDDRTEAVAYHWNGREWTAAAPPQHGLLLSIWGSSREGRVLIGTDSGEVLRLEKGRWDVAEVALGGKVRQIAGLGPESLWAVTDEGLVHWNGKAWLRVTSDVGRDAIAVAVTVSGAAAEEIWVATRSGRVYRGDGERWKGDHVAGAGQWNLWASPGGEVWMGDQWSLYRFDGKRWVNMSKTMPGAIQALAFTGDSVWAAGARGLLARWDGQRWSNWATRLSNARLRAVWSPAPGEVWAASEREATLLRRAGGRWSNVPAPEGFGLSDMWGSNPYDVWGVGDAIAHWDGTRWTRVRAHVWFHLDRVWGSAPDDVWAVGREGVARFDGQRWSIVVLGETPPLDSMWAASPREVWLASGHMLLKWDGRRLTSEMRLQEKVTVWGAGHTGFVVESGGRTMAYDPGASQWRTTAEYSPRVRRVVAGTTAAGWGIDENGLVHQFDGQRWTRVRGVPIARVDAVHEGQGGELWMVGAQGAVVMRPSTSPANTPVAAATGAHNGNGTHAIEPPPLSGVVPPPAPEAATKPSPAAAPGPSRLPGKRESLSVARRWLNLLAEQNPDGLLTNSSVPFVFAGFELPAGPLRESCAGGSDGGAPRGVIPFHPAGIWRGALNEEEMRDLLDCALRDRRLIAGLKGGETRPGADSAAGFTGPLRVLDVRRLPRRLARYRNELLRLAADHVLVEARMLAPGTPGVFAAVAVRSTGQGPRIDAAFVDDGQQ